MSDFLLPTVVGISSGLLLFLVASGLTLIFGVMRIVNFAHGGFFMIGAYLTHDLLPKGTFGPARFGLAVLIAAVATALIGAVLERLVYSRMYTAPAIYTLLATYALLLLIEGGAEEKWARDPLSVSLPKGLDRAVEVAGVTIPTYHFVVIAVALVVIAVLYLIVYRTRLGLDARAIAADRDMAAALGINIRWVYTALFTLGIFFAGVAGGLRAPLTQLTPSLGGVFIIDAFAVVVLGGLGSMGGTLVASLVLGLFSAYMVTYAPSLSGYSVYAALVIVLLVRPTGLFGKGGSLESLH